MSGRTIRAPFTEHQIHWLNEFQHGGYWHPFTCQRRDAHYQENEGILLADLDGWHCPHDGCDYRQDWAWSFMADEDFNRRCREDHEALLRIAESDSERPDDAI